MGEIFYFANWTKDRYVKNRDLQDIKVRPTVGSIKWKKIMAVKEDVSLWKNGGGMKNSLGNIIEVNKSSETKATSIL